MRVAHTVAELGLLRAELTAASPDATVAFIPTMGALHAGHRSLIRLAEQLADLVVVSIFVNPLQFGPDEDYARYPRVLDDDLEVCRADGVDLVFVPSVSELYPAGRQVTVSAGALGQLLEGEFRPGHFDGVLTVVAKLLNLVRPDTAIFGQKDAQQLACIRRMTTDLNVGIEIVAAPIIREDDGLALSSRNRYLLPHERRSALALSAALRAAGRRESAATAVDAAREVLELAESDLGFRVQYVNLVHPQSFAELPPDHVGPGLLLVAATVGDTRLIDNTELTFAAPSDSDRLSVGELATGPHPYG